VWLLAADADHRLHIDDYRADRATAAPLHVSISTFTAVGVLTSRRFHREERPTVVTD
jgi:hypothetical protein